MESWDLQYGRLIYSIFILLLQLILPSLILILAHASIYRKLVSSRFLLRRSSKENIAYNWCLPWRHSVSKVGIWYRNIWDERIISFVSIYKKNLKDEVLYLYNLILLIERRHSLSCLRSTHSTSRHNPSTAPTRRSRSLCRKGTNISNYQSINFNGGNIMIK